jgi:hypothetical protein
MAVPPFIPFPATGDDFIGRQEFVRNLRGRIARNENLAIIGGPKLGKTSLGRHQWEPFVHRLRAEIGEGSERRLLLYLIMRGNPINPALAQAETGIRDIKAAVDTLVYLGVISRWVRNEEATLFADCRLLNNHISTG